jgi:hypothetical protein
LPEGTNDKQLLVSGARTIIVLQISGVPENADSKQSLLSVAPRKEVCLRD